MKLTYEDKIKIYQLRKQGETLKNLSRKYDIDGAHIEYLVRLIDRFGIEIVKKEKTSLLNKIIKRREVILKTVLRITNTNRYLDRLNAF